MAGQIEIVCVVVGLSWWQVLVLSSQNTAHAFDIFVPTDRSRDLHFEFCESIAITFE
jgi:hypothetical protein